MKRDQRKEERRLAADHSVAEASKAAVVHSAATVETVEDAHDADSRSVEPLPCDRRTDHPCPSPEVSPPATDQAASSTETAASGPVSRSSEDCGGFSPREGGPSAGSLPTEPEQFEFAPGIVAYIQFVISLLEGRDVHREEILEMLARTRRQRSLAREKRIDYVLRRLAEEPEKPP